MLRIGAGLWVGLFLGSVLAAADDAAEQELRSTVDAYAASYNEGAVDKVMSFWTEDADFVDIRGNFHKGRDLISALFRRGFADNPGRTIKMISDERKLLAPSVAMDDGILELRSPDGEVARGRYAVVWTKTDAQWRIRSARDIPLEIATAEPEGARSLEDLQGLLGKWEAKSERTSVTLDCRQALHKKFLIQKFQIQSGDEEAFEVVTYITFDPSEECLRSWYFDSRGGFGGGLWSKLQDEWRAEIVAVLPDGQLGKSWMTWRLVDQDTLQWTASERQVGEALLPDAEQTYVRVSK